MIKPLLVSACVAVLSAANGLAVESPSGNANEKWIARFQQYASQKEIQPESGYSQPKSGIALGDLLRTLPEPQDWPGLQQGFEDKIARGSALPADDLARLTAGKWLIAYLRGDRVAVKMEVEAAAKRSKPESDAEAALDSLAQQVVRAHPIHSPDARQVELFEQNLQMLEPVDLEAVKRDLGGEENYQRLVAFVAAYREFAVKMSQIEGDWQKSRDDANAQKKLEALNHEFEAKFQKDREMLEPYLNKPSVRRFFHGELFENARQSGDAHVESLYVPDLIAVVGKESATSLLRRAFHVQARLAFSSDVSEAMRQLAREVALSEMATIKVPSWTLVNDIHSGALFEALRDKFPNTGPAETDYQSAAGFYLAGLIVEGKVDAAVKFAAERPKSSNPGNEIKLPYVVMGELERTHPERLWEFLRGWLSAVPSVDEWDRFTRLSVALNKTAELQGLIKRLAESPAFTGENRTTIQRMQAGVEMATGDFAAAKRRLGDLVRTPARDARERATQESIVQHLLELARLQRDDAEFKTMLTVGESYVAAEHSSTDTTNSFASELVSSLNDWELFADAARVGQAELDWVAVREKSRVEKSEQDESASFLMEYTIPKLLGEQLRAYVGLGSWKNARELLQENPFWNKKDVTGMLGESLGLNLPTGYFVAKTVEAEGNPGLARQILEAQLVQTPGSDTVYASYLKLAGPEAQPLLDKLAASDHYEERPLIWKARLQLDARNTDAAIVTLQQAIGIDPSDGEQGRGDRMRVYSFMAEAMAAKGDLTKASFYSNVVKAIRLSETADRWYEIGAYGKAIDLYREALGFFQDAYCIQSRLAIRLAEAGKMDEAIEHYRHAFELMPDSFGRVESHCFGCEKAFAGKRSQDVAEEVFNRMLQSRPDKPQLHYLLGYLREEQENFAEAAKHYRRAVELDPLYLNAWKKLAGLSDKLNLTTEEHDKLLLSLLALDPGRKRSYVDLESVSDVARLWRAMNEARGLLVELPAPTSLYRLKASAELIAKKNTAPEVQEVLRSPEDFAGVLVKHDFVAALQVYLAVLNQPPSTEETSGK